MPDLPVPTGRIEYLLAGSGEPVTIFAHGLGGSIAATRPLGSGVPGTRAFFHFRQHGGTRIDGHGFGYDVLAAELDAVATHVGASQALGVSLGAGALLRLAVADPHRFRRLVFFLPPALDRARAGASAERAERLLAATTAGIDAVEDLVIDEVPPLFRHRPEAAAYVAERARAVVRTREGLAELIGAAPIPDRAALRSVDLPCLVIGAAGDPLHDAGIARELAAALPSARLHIFGDAWPVWNSRTELRALLAGFLR
ncbi:MAG: alpha/beta fold hydrolase [Mycobacteriales bacterium]